MDDEKYMRMALELAKRGEGFVSPNPMVGAVIVKDGRVIGQGWHERYSELHAERNALKNCTESAGGATIYVTLEPCCHHGKQPPCTDAILESGISRVVIGSADPNPLVSGGGVRILKEHGIEVKENVLREECDSINPIFFHYIKTGLPYVVMKYAMTLDGKIAAYTGESKWITGEAARAHVQTQRHRFRGIMAGIGTVLADDPLLTCRMEGGRNPIRIICDSGLRTPIDSQIVSTAGEIETIIATCVTDENRHAPYKEKGCTVLPVKPQLQNGDIHSPIRIDPVELMKKLGELKIDSILLEGGGTLNWSVLNAGLVSAVQAYIAPKLFGGAGAKSPVEGQGVAFPSEAFMLKNTKVTKLGDDFLIEGEVDKKCLRE
jgi:diaminohydroxyphosphoribosylaminopyrimidine deaminase/5-amino-6-(5-phosphoribosylamino)uracil reductase